MATDWDKIRYFFDPEKVPPKNPFEHAYRLLKSPPKNVTDFKDLIHEFVLLANLGDDRILRAYQVDFDLLTMLLDARNRDPRLTPLFRALYTQTIIELAMTRAYKGLERQLQAWIPPRLQEGFGSHLSKIFGKKDETEEILKKLLSGEKGGW